MSTNTTTAPRRSSRRLATKVEKEVPKESESVPVRATRSKSKLTSKTAPKSKPKSTSKSKSTSKASASASKQLTATKSSAKGKQEAGKVANAKTLLKSTPERRTTRATSRSAEVENVGQQSPKVKGDSRVTRTRKASALSNEVILTQAKVGQMDDNILTCTTAERTRMNRNRDGTTTTTTSSDRKRKSKEEEVHSDGTTTPGDAMEGSSSQSINADGRLKRQRRQTMKPIVSDNNMEADSSSQPQTVASAPLPVNRTDPCAVLPIEVWHQILSFLHLSQVATIANVSKIWLDGSRSYPVWRTICELNGLGAPKRKYQSYLALACSRSSYICEKCLSITMGQLPQKQSNIPLPVRIINDEDEDEKEEGEKRMEPEEERAEVNLGLELEEGKKEEQDAEMDKIKQEEDEQKKKEEEQKRKVEEEMKKKKEQDNTWMLCVTCRREYYKEHPEPMRTFEMVTETVWEAYQITKTLACKNYHLDAGTDLAGIRYRERRNPHHSLAPNMRLYDLEGIQKRALYIHGGWIGVDAITKGIAKKRRIAYKDRNKPLQTTRPSLEKSNSKEGSNEIILTQESDASAGDTQYPASHESNRENGAMQVIVDLTQ